MKVSDSVLHTHRTGMVSPVFLGGRGPLYMIKTIKTMAQILLSGICIGFLCHLLSPWASNTKVDVRNLGYPGLERESII